MTNEITFSVIRSESDKICLDLSLVTDMLQYAITVSTLFLETEGGCGLAVVAERKKMLDLGFS